MDPRRPRPPAVLRRLADRFVRGPDTSFILDDLDELWARDLERGMSRLRAMLRYARNALVSGAHTRKAGRRGFQAVSWLDVKLGIRMLAKYPGLAVVGTLALSVGIGLGAAYMEFITDLFRPTLPLEEGDRLVGIRNRDVAAGGDDPRSLHDLVTWREELESVDELGAFRSIERNLITGDGWSEPVSGVSITPSAFSMTGVPALMGRPLVEADGRESAAAVVVLGHAVWTSRFGADPDIIDRIVRLGEAPHQVVGVMPEGFAFPINHRFWVPLSLEALLAGHPEPARGPPLEAFGRLAPGSTLEEAQAELTTLRARRAADSPGTHEHLRPRVMPYTELLMGGGGSELYWIESVFVGLLVLLGANVATLVFARTATREGEIAVRTALGASRGRIVGQLFVEALVLALVATLVGLLVANWVAVWGLGLLWEALGGAPFWWDRGLSPSTVVAALALAVVGAGVVGVVPGLAATGSRVQARLQRAAASGSSMRLGRVWSGLLIMQIAVSVVLLPGVVGGARNWIRGQAAPQLGFPAKEYLAVRLEADHDPAVGMGASGGPSSPRPAATLSAFRATLGELQRRLLAEPGVSGVAFADRLPNMNQPTRRIEVEGVATPSDRRGVHLDEAEFQAAPGHEVEVAAVEPDFFEVMGADMLAGRTFGTMDLEPDARAVVVNRSFVEEVLEGRNAVGRRIRYAVPADEEPGPWHEIVGVADDLVTELQLLSTAGNLPGLYHPLTDRHFAETGLLEPAPTGDGTWSVRMALHAPGGPEALAPRVRAVAADLDPTLRLYDLQRMDRLEATTGAVRSLNRFLVVAVVIVVLIVMAISASGTYALMSFTVARRRREIGIRAALGADPRRLVTSVFSRALRQIGLGVLAGASVWLAMLLIPSQSGMEDVTMEDVAVCLVVVAVIAAVGLVACGVPARRALRIEPTEALKEG